MNELAPLQVSQARIPQTYANAKSALYTCASIDECQQWADKAAALASYAKQAEDEELMKMAIRIRDRAVRRAGELLKQIPPARGANQNITDADDSKVLTRTDAAREAGMSERQQVTAIRVANVPAEEFERQVEGKKPPTVTALAKQGTTSRPVIDLKGRDPNEFNRALHFIAEFEEYAKAVAAFDLDAILPTLNSIERLRVKSAIAKIDPIHDRIMTRI
jgi:hypothetical protein